MNVNYFFKIIFLLLLAISCSEKKPYTGKNAAQRNFIAKNNIVQLNVYAVRNDWQDPYLSYKVVYSNEGDEIAYESYFGGKVFRKTKAEYDNGLLIVKTNEFTGVNTSSQIRNEYDANGKRIKYEIVDDKGKITATFKIKWEGNTETARHFDDKSTLIETKVFTYDSLENPLTSGTRKFRYKYNKNGTIAESRSTDTSNNSHTVRLYFYKDLLPVKEIIMNDSTRIEHRYEYIKSSGEKWNK